jgi:hypothetical protein
MPTLVRTRRTTCSLVRAALTGVAGAAAAMLLVCCGGGGGGFTPAAPPAATLCTGSASYAVWSDTAAEVGKAAGAAIAGCTGPVTGVTWTQVSGPPVTLLAARSQAISFEPPGAGSYGFTASFTDAAGSPRTAQVVIAATAPATAGSRVLVRLDHAVRGGNSVSLRAWPQLAAGDGITALRWTQVAGPAVTNLDTTSDPSRVLFTAPSVTQDTLVRFRATLTTTLGTTASDDATVLVVRGPTPATGNTAVWDDPLSDVHPFRPAGPYAAVLVGCAYNPQSVYAGSGSTNLCNLGTLPLLGQAVTNGLPVNGTPTVDEVMDRVVVSHDWMGEVFQQFLQTQDTLGDFRRLLKGVTAVVIGSHVRPSFYYALTGAIYLDADFLWLTPEQRDFVNEQPDYRSGFDKDLGYTGLWRYTLNNVSVQPFYAANARTTRAISALAFELGDLLYHELAHANDFNPQSVRAGLNPALGAWDNALARVNAAQLPSDQLATAAYSLQSVDLKGLACVKFFGKTATATQVGFTPAQVGARFSPDRATDEYNYAAPPDGSGACPSANVSREDLAMVFEEFMMATRHGVRRDVAFTNKFTPGLTGSQLFVQWGQRGRIGDALLNARTKLIVPLIAPWIDPALVDALPVPVAMRNGESWTANLTLPGPPRVGAFASPAVAERAGPVDDARTLEREFGGARRHGLDAPGGAYGPRQMQARLGTKH